MKILDENLFKEYKNNIWDLKKNIDLFLKNSKDISFDFLVQTSSVYSSNIEWNTLDINTFMNYSISIKKSKNKEIEEIESLIKAYNFAKENKLSEENFLKTHKISSKTILINSKRWKYRDEKVWVFWSKWMIYLAIEPEFVKEKMNLLFSDIEYLLKSDLTLEETFYYASLIHLVFVHIHPFTDWNWRTARLLEKWFLTSKLWKDFWKIESEKYYKENRQKYYDNINLWVNFYELDYWKSLPFLNMLVKSLS